jgi:hypothetical protein
LRPLATADPTIGVGPARYPQTAEDVDACEECCQVTFDFIIDLDTLVVRSATDKYVTGAVWLAFGDREFPDRGWNDAPLSVLGSFGAAIENVQRQGEADFYFFEGPLFVKLLIGDLAAEDPIVRVCAVRERVSGETGDLVGDIEVETSLPLSALRSLYMRSLRELREWAESRIQKEIAALLSEIAARYAYWEDKEGPG